jgi:hypothetical protein
MRNWVIPQSKTRTSGQHKNAWQAAGAKEGNKLPHLAAWAMAWQ